MINDPSVMAILQARRQYNARNPNSIITANKGGGQTDPPESDPPQVQPPAVPSPADRAAARQTAPCPMHQSLELDRPAGRARKRAAGLVPVEVWVPADKSDEIRRIAREMCDKGKTE